MVTNLLSIGLGPGYPFSRFRQWRVRVQRAAVFLGRKISLKNPHCVLYAQCALDRPRQFSEGTLAVLPCAVAYDDRSQSRQADQVLEMFGLLL